ncbi:MAG: glycosyltransferase family 2 protein [Desulfobulbus sp.]|uniref:glycosyltransferase n=1 Tax=Desulfobulbus sp. TaxID=895 RepID=UPI00283B4DF3|nr:glycosyltransferase family A protein [Desulfobulbus sp.]MDR2550385.1 glycosyltransferase family 2 protein [Desulfobulbus sp.]
MRRCILQNLFRLFPFELKGDAVLTPATGDTRISCVINFYGRLDLLQGILFSLADQDYPRDRFEVLLVEDRGGTVAGRKLSESFASCLPVRYLPLDRHFGKMGYARNYGLVQSQGKIILFLDDDTVLLQRDFLTQIDALFAEHRDIDVLVPHGQASYTLVAGHYDFHDPYFMTSRCTAYRREVLQDLGGFMESFVGQEDVEFVTRFTIANKKALQTATLRYAHPPLLVPNTRKSRAVGFSFYNLRNRYSWPVWLLLLCNCARHAPLILFPSRRCREQGRFGIGFLWGIVDGIKGRQGQVYG